MGLGRVCSPVHTSSHANFGLNMRLHAPDTAKQICTLATRQALLLLGWRTAQHRQASGEVTLSPASKESSAKVCVNASSGSCAPARQRSHMLLHFTSTEFASALMSNTGDMRQQCLLPAGG